MSAAAAAAGPWGRPGAGLSMNPQLPSHPLGQYTDSTYEAGYAQLRAQMMKNYNDILQQLGYSNAQGQYIPGTVEIAANRQRSDLVRNQSLAAQDVTDQMQRASTLFSGYRGTQQARAEFPFAQGIAQLDVDVPRALAGLYNQAGDITNQFTLQNNLLLAEAAQRRAAALAAIPVVPSAPSYPSGPSGPSEPGPAQTPDPFAGLANLSDAQIQQAGLDPALYARLSPAQRL